MWHCEHCGCRGIAGSLASCPHCGKERTVPKTTVQDGPSNRWEDAEQPAAAPPAEPEEPHKAAERPEPAAPAPRKAAARKARQKPAQGGQ